MYRNDNRRFATGDNAASGVILDVFLGRSRASRARVVALALSLLVAPYALAQPLSVGLAQSQAVAFRTIGATTTGFDSRGRTVYSSGPYGTHGYRYGTDGKLAGAVDDKGNLTTFRRDAGGAILEARHDFVAHATPWYERYVSDADRNSILASSEANAALLVAHAGQLGIPASAFSAFPDAIQVTLGAARSIGQIRIYTVQDDATSQVDPAARPDLTFSNNGVTDIEVQYQVVIGKKPTWVDVPGGLISGNRSVGMSISFPAVSTAAIQVLIRGALGGYSRIAEIEAYDTRGVNVAFHASCSASSTLDAGHACAYAVDGARVGTPLGAGYWSDATLDAGAAIGAPVTVESVADGFRKRATSNAFASLTQFRSQTPIPFSLPAPGGDLLMARDITQALGHGLAVSRYLTHNGLEEWDDQGGARYLGHDSSDRLIRVADLNGYFVKITYDSLGRPAGVYLGDDTVLVRYNYDAQGWQSTELVNLTNSRRYFLAQRRAKPGSEFPEMHATTTATLPGAGIVAEWDPYFDQKALEGYNSPGYFVALLDGLPYAYIPMQNSGLPYDFNRPARRSITLFADEAMSGRLAKEAVLRVDYTDSTITVLTATSAEEQNAGAHRVALTFARATGSNPFTASAATAATPRAAVQPLAEGDGAPDEQDVTYYVDWVSGLLMQCIDGACQPANAPDEINVNTTPEDVPPPPPPPVFPPPFPPGDPYSEGDPNGGDCVDVNTCGCILGVTCDDNCTPPTAARGFDFATTPPCQCKPGMVPQSLQNPTACMCPRGSTYQNGTPPCVFTLLPRAIKVPENLIQSALDNLRAKLNNPDCANLLSDPGAFGDLNTGNWPMHYLFSDLDSLLSHVDIDHFNHQDPATCRGNNALTTAPFAGTIYICQGGMVESPGNLATTLLHELLHANGLLEDPTYPHAPTSAQISGRIRERCGV